MLRVATFVVLVTAILAGQDTVGLTKEKERALGESMARDVGRRATIVDDSMITAYLTGVAQKLAQQCWDKAPVEVRAIASEQRNGYAMPGGFLFVNVGLIQNSSNEAELAGVLAHLIARSYAPHAVSRSSDLSIPIIFVGSWAGYSYAPDARVLMPLGFLQAYQAAVSAADQRAVYCLDATDYDPGEFLLSLRKLPREEPRISSHPPAAQRIEHVQSVIDTLEPRAEHVVNTDQFDAVRQRVETLLSRAYGRVAVRPSLLRGSR